MSPTRTPYTTHLSKFYFGAEFKAGI